MTIQLNVEVQEAQAILNFLSKGPFEQVADLWFKIKSQAEQQLAQQAQAPQQAEDDPAAGLNDPEQA